MTQNKTTPLSERKCIEPNFYDVRDNPITFYTEEDVKEAVRRLIERIYYFQSNFIVLDEDTAQIRIDDWEDLKQEIKEIFGKELCEEEKQNENI